VVTNQSGIGRGLHSEADFTALTAWMRDRFAAAGAPLDRVEHCPDVRPSRRRKPGPGMLLDAAASLGLDLAASVMVGDRMTDMCAAAGVGGRLLFLGSEVRTTNGDTRINVLPIEASLSVAISFI